MEDCDLFRYASFEERIPMTLQVGLIGSDGFVLASDTKASNGFGSTTTRKLILVGPMVCAVSGDHILSTLGRKLIDAYKPEIVWSERAESIVEDLPLPSYKRSQLSGSLIFALPEWDVFQEVSVTSGVVASMPFNPAFGGDSPNLATYFCKAYYSSSKTVQELSVLAAHTIIEAARVNPSSIGGLEIVVGRKGEEARYLNESELRFLRDKSGKVYQITENAIVG
jgi:hypothetical protein